MFFVSKCSTLLFVFDLIATVLAAAVPPNTSHGHQVRSVKQEKLNLPLHNVSANLPPTADFGLEITGGRTILNSRGCFFDIIVALSGLSAVDFDGHVDNPETISSPNVFGVALHMSGPQGRGGFDVKYMIWGLALAAKWMTDERNFRDWQFELAWDRRVVGALCSHLRHLEKASHRIVRPRGRE